MDLLLLATFQDGGDQRSQLRVCVLGVVDMRSTLLNVSDTHITSRGKHTQSPFRSISRARQWDPAPKKLGKLPTNRSSIRQTSRKYLAKVRVSTS